MTPYTIHIQEYGIDPEGDIRAVKEGFNWMAFVFTFIWALVKGYWWVALGLFGVNMALSLGVALIGLDVYAQGVVSLGFNLLAGLYANDLARWTLGRRGYRNADVVMGAGSLHAIETHLTRNAL